METIETKETYYSKNKDKMKMKNKAYYVKNKETILQKIRCINCSGSYCLASMATHFKTNKHLKSLQLNSEEEIRKFEMEEDNNIDYLLCGNIIL